MAMSAIVACVIELSGLNCEWSSQKNRQGDKVPYGLPSLYHEAFTFDEKHRRHSAATVVIAQDKSMIR